MFKHAPVNYEYIAFHMKKYLLDEGNKIINDVNLINK